MNCSKNCVVVKKQIWLPNKEHLRDHTYEGSDMTNKCKVFVAVT